jgi:hypothetical protein
LKYSERRRNRRIEIWLSTKSGELDDPGYVRWVQSCLNRVLGVGLPVTGALDSRTRRAISNFQQRQRLADRGTITPQTVIGLVQTCGFPNIRGGGVGPDSFKFKEKIPDDGQGEAGGWQETDCELVRFVSPGFLPTVIDVRLVVGVPLRNKKQGKITPQRAQAESQEAANLAGLEVTAMLNAGEIIPSQVPQIFMNLMRVHLLIEGRRVTGCSGGTRRADAVFTF